MPVLRPCVSCSGVFAEASTVTLPGDRAVCQDCCARTANYVLTTSLSELAEIWTIDVAEGRNASRISDGIGPDVVDVVSRLLVSPAPGSGAVALMRMGLTLEAVAVAATARSRASLAQDVTAAEVELACRVLFDDQLFSEGGFARLRSRVALRH